MNGFTIEQGGELKIGFEDCDDPITCTAQNMPLRLRYYPTGNLAAIQYQPCEHSSNYGANGNEHLQTISGLNAATEYTIIIQSSTDVVSSQSDCPNMNAIAMLQSLRCKIA